MARGSGATVLEPRRQAGPGPSLLVIKAHLASVGADLPPWGCSFCQGSGSEKSGLASVLEKKSIKIKIDVRIEPFKFSCSQDGK